MPSRTSLVWTLNTVVPYHRGSIIESIVGIIYHLQYVEHNGMMLLILDRLEQAKEKTSEYLVWDGTRWHLSSKETGNLIIDQVWKRRPGQWFFFWKAILQSGHWWAAALVGQAAPTYVSFTVMNKIQKCCSRFWQLCSCVLFKSLNSISERHKHAPEEAQTHVECMQAPNTPNRRIHNYKILDWD